MNSTPTTSFTTRQIEYERLGASALFLSYLAGEEKALKYYAHDPWTEEGRAEAARIAAAAHPRDRDVLVDVLLEQNSQWWGEEEDGVRANVERLRDLESVAVITGQQLGLFGGPLYTVYKALTAVKLTEQMKEEMDRSVVPVFWLADEDHDFAEVHTTTLPNGADPIRISYDDGQAPDLNRGPVGRIVLGEEIGATIEQLFRSFPQAPDWIRDVWMPGVLWRDAFAHTLRKLTKGTGLVFVSGDDPRLKCIATPIFAREIERWTDTASQLATVSSGLENDGFHTQIQPGEVNLFMFHENQRLQIDPEGDGFVLRGTDVPFTKKELLNELDTNPERISPNVVLRPLMQDTLFPTAAYVGGPGELAYFAQLKLIYEAFGVPMPVIYPRISLTLISEKLQRFLDEYNIDLPDVKGDIHELHRRLALERSDAGLDGQFGEAAKLARDLIESLKPTATAVDSSLDKAVEAAQARVGKALTTLEKKTIRAEKRNQHVILERLERLAGELLPGGVPQERVVCALTSLAMLPPAELLDVVNSDTRGHQMVEK